MIFVHIKKDYVGVLGEKGQRYTKILFEETDYILSMGSRLAPYLLVKIITFFQMPK